MKRAAGVIGALVLAAAMGLSQHQDDYPVLKGPYLGQKPPGMTPENFAPGIVSTEGQKEFCCTFSSDGKEFYFNRNMQIMVSKWLKTGWSKPEPVKFTEGYRSHEPHITADNKRLFFGSMRPRPGFPDEENPYGIWMAERTEEGWSKPRYVGYGMYVTTTRDGEIYLEDIRDAANMEFCIARTKLVNGHFEEFVRQKGGMDRPAPDRLPGGHPCISPDGSFIIFDSGQIKTRMTANLFICFREDLDTWSEAIRFDDRINKPKEATLCPYLSPDGKYLFFSRMVEETGDIYWVDAKVIEDLRPKRKDSGKIPMKPRAIFIGMTNSACFIRQPMTSAGFPSRSSNGVFFPWLIRHGGRSGRFTLFRMFRVTLKEISP